MGTVGDGCCWTGGERGQLEMGIAGLEEIENSCRLALGELG